MILTSLPTTYKTSIFEYLFLLSLFTSQISECINDDTKDEVKNNNNNNEEEEQVVHYPCEKEWLLKYTEQRSLTPR